MANYAKPLPRDNGGIDMQNYPAPVKAITSVYYRDNLTVSSVITLDQNCNTIEVGTAGGQGAVIRWIPIGETATVAPFGSVITSGVGANFDHYIPANAQRRFVVPRETQGVGNMQGPVGIGSVNGLYQRIATASSGVSSVILIQY